MWPENYFAGYWPEDYWQAAAGISESGVAITFTAKTKTFRFVVKSQPVSFRVGSKQFEFKLNAA